MLYIIQWKKKSKMRDKKYLSMLGMARRAGKLSMGHDMAEKAIKSKTATLVVFASNASDRLYDEFQNILERYGIDMPCIRISETIDEIHFALGYKAGVITVDDSNFSKRIIELIKQEENEL